MTGSVPFTVEVEKDMTVKDFKEFLKSNEHFPKSMTYESIRIISFGKFLDDETKTLEDYRVNEGGRIIVYVQKKPAAPAPAPAPAPVPAQVPSSTTPITPPVTTTDAPASPAAGEEMAGGNREGAASGSEILPPAPAQQPIQPAPLPPVQPPAPAIPAPAPAAPAGPEVDPDKLAQLVGMGFNENDSRRALAAARGNVEMAVDYIISGNIPAPPPAAPAVGAVAAPPGVSQEEVQRLLRYLQENDPETYAQVSSNPVLLQQLLIQAGILRPAASAAPAQGFGAPFGNPNPIAAGPGFGAIPGAGAGALGIALSEAEQGQVRSISEITGLDEERCKVIFARLGRSPDAACDIIFEYGDKFRALTPAQLDAMFAQMQRNAAAAAAAGGMPGGGAGQFGYDSDDDDSGSSDDGNSGDDDDDDRGDDDFYL